MQRARRLPAAWLKSGWKEGVRAQCAAILEHARAATKQHNAAL
jgi:hypothetical protein